LKSVPIKFRSDLTEEFILPKASNYSIVILWTKCYSTL